MTSKLRTAVVGVGYLGRFHAQKYKQLPDTELVGVCDLNPDNARKIAEELQVPAFFNAQELIGKVDAVSIASTTRTHYELTKLFLENGVHVLVEKPMTLKSTEGEELCQIAKSKKLKLQVGHVERFNSAFVAAQEKLNNPLFIEAHRLAPFKPRSTDVDVILDVMIHDLDVLMALVKSKAKSVSAVGVPVITGHTDIANARIEFESGCVANVTASRVSMYSTRKFRVFQPDQYLSIDFEKGDISLITKVGEWEQDKIPLENQMWNLKKTDAILEETKAFVDAILKNKPVPVPGEDAVRALKLAERILEDIQRRHV